MSDDPQEAFEAGWRARDARCVPARRLIGRTEDPNTYVATEDVSGMMLEDYEDWLDESVPPDNIVRQRKPLPDKEARARSMSRHPSNENPSD